MLEQDCQDDIVTLRLAHGKANAADLELMQALSDAFYELRDARAVILSSAGKIFSAGVDLARMIQGGNAYAAEFIPVLDRVLREMFEFPAPLVTAVNGHAIAGGCMFALAGDYRLMARGKGRIGAPELMVSVPFPAAPLELLRFALPPQHLQKHIYTGETLLADEALAKGFVDEVTEPDELLDRAQAMARHLASLPAANFRLSKAMVRGDAIKRMHANAAEFNPAVFARWAEPETIDGIRAYMAKLGG